MDVEGDHEMLEISYADQEDNPAGSSDSRLAWTKCVMGCQVAESAEVYLLSCFHVVCSDNCAEKLKKEPILVCKVCGEILSLEQLETKIIIKNAFKKKPTLEDVKLLCENCVWNRPASEHCSTCSISLCDKCSAFHRETRATRGHKMLTDLTTVREEKLQKLLIEEETCQTSKDHAHNPLIYFCTTCDTQVCDACTSLHIEHEIYNIETDKEELKIKVDISRDFVEKCERAIDEIKKKRKEILQVEWSNIQSRISHQFYVMLSVLKRRHLELQREARIEFMRQLAQLNSNLKYSEQFKDFGERFFFIAEDIKNNRSIKSNVNFLKYSQKYVDSICDLDKRLALELDRFVDKDYHFELDDANDFQVQQCLRNYGRVEYKFRSGSSTRIMKTYSNVNKGDETNDINKHAATSEPAPAVPISTHSPPTVPPGTSERPGSRRVAVKSTAGIPIISSSSLAASKPLVSQVVKTYSRKKPDNKPQESQPTGSSKDISITVQGNETIREADTTIAQPQLKHSGNINHTEGTMKNSGTATETNRKILDAKKELVIGGHETVSTDKIPLASGEPRKTREKSTTSSDETIPIGKVTRRRGSSVSKIIPDALPPRLSPAHTPSPSETPTDQGLGKRERKKKSFPPEFIDSDIISIKYLRKQAPPESGSGSGRVRRKSAAGIAGQTHTPHVEKLPKLDLEEPQLLDLDHDLDVEIEMITRRSLDLNHPNIKRSGSAMDGSESGTSGERRQSLRLLSRQATPAPDSASRKSPAPPKSQTPKPRVSKSSGTATPGRGSTLKSSSSAKSSMLPTGIDDSDFQEVPKSTLENPREWSDFPVQGEEQMKISNEDENDDFCYICRDGGAKCICCDYCPKVFHLKCHIPPLDRFPKGDEKWRCNYDTTKENVDQLISACSVDSCASDVGLVAENKKDFLLACKFIMECYKIPEIPTMRWKFPRGYLNKYGRVPVHLKYIHKRLCLGTPKHFSSVEEMLRALRVMFMQAFLFYKEKVENEDYKPYAKTCFEKFLQLLEIYYPEHQDIFKDVMKYEESLTSESDDMTK